jgi:hypothetical protein
MVPIGQIPSAVISSMLAQNVSQTGGIPTTAASSPFNQSLGAATAAAQYNQGQVAASVAGVNTLPHQLSSLRTEQAETQWRFHTINQHQGRQKGGEPFELSPLDQEAFSALIKTAKFLCQGAPEKNYVVAMFYQSVGDALKRHQHSGPGSAVDMQQCTDSEIAVDNSVASQSFQQLLCVIPFSGLRVEPVHTTLTTYLHGQSSQKRFGGDYRVGGHTLANDWVAFCLQPIVTEAINILPHMTAYRCSLDPYHSLNGLALSFGQKCPQGWPALSFSLFIRGLSDALLKPQQGGVDG